MRSLPSPRNLWLALRNGSEAFWSNLQGETQRRLKAAGAAVVVVAAFLLLLVPVLPCGFPGGDDCAPPDDAVGLVPAAALAYLHLTVDPDGDQFEDASEIASRLPLITEGELIDPLLGQFPGRGGKPADFQREIEPWLEEQVAMAVLPGDGGSLEQVQLLEIDDAERAARYARSVAGGEPRTERYRGVEIADDGEGLATASLDGFLVIGSRSALERVIDAERGANDARSLADVEHLDEVRDAFPDERFAYAYVSQQGLRRLISRAGSVLRALESLIAPGATRGAGVALSASDDELRIAIRSVLDPKRAKSDFFSAFSRFEPSLAGELSEDALAYLGFGDPGRAVRKVLTQAGAEQPGLVAAFSELVARIRRLGRVNIERELLPALGDEAALALESRPARQGERPGGGDRGASQGLPGPSAPYAALLADGVGEQRARNALARLQVPIIRALGPRADAPALAFQKREIGEIEAQSLRYSPMLNLTYAVFDSMVVVASDPAGVSQVASGEGGLDESDAFERATDDFPDDPSLLGYLDLTDLVKLAERAGLAADPVYAAFASEIRKLETLGLAVIAGEDSLSTDIRVIVSEDGDEDEDSPAGGVPQSD